MLTCLRHGPQKVQVRGNRAWCAQFVGVGKDGANDKGYCSVPPVTVQDPQPQPVTAPAPAPPAPAIAQPQANPAPYPTPAELAAPVPHFDERDDVLDKEARVRLAALEFAGRLYSGAVPFSAGADLQAQIESAALKLATKTVQWFYTGGE